MKYVEGASVQFEMDLVYGPSKDCQLWVGDDGEGGHVCKEVCRAAVPCQTLWCLQSALYTGTVCYECAVMLIRSVCATGILNRPVHHMMCAIMVRCTARLADFLIAWHAATTFATITASIKKKADALNCKCVRCTLPSRGVHSVVWC